MTERSPDADSPEGLRCDFCGTTVESVRRVALDRNYDRLLLPHRELYACADCSHEKERVRKGFGGRPRRG